MKGHSPAQNGFVEDLFGKRPEIFDQKSVPARRKDSAADLVAGKRPSLKGNDFKAGIDKTFGCSRPGKACP
jgi:hypothetical protein